MTIHQYSGNNQTSAVPVLQLGMLCTLWMTKLIRYVKPSTDNRTAVTALRSEQALQPTSNCNFSSYHAACC